MVLDIQCQSNKAFWSRWVWAETKSKGLEPLVLQSCLFILLYSFWNKNKPGHGGGSYLMNNHQKMESEYTCFVGVETAEWAWGRNQGGGSVGIECPRLGGGWQWDDNLSREVAQCVSRPVKHYIQSNSFMLLELVRDILLNLELLKLETIKLQNHRLCSF